MDKEKEIFIIIKEEALMEMVLSALEGFAIKNLEKKKYQNRYLEVYGLLWGSLVKYSGNDNDIENYIYTISHLSIDTTAKRSKDSVESNDDALILKKDVITSFWPHYRFLGDFHTHPYKRRKNFDYKDIDKDKLYDFTKYDFAFIKDDAEFWYEHNYRVGVVMTIIDMQNKSDIIRQVKDNLIMFNLGNYRLWVKGYWVSYKKDKKNKIKANVTDDVYLRCPYLTGMCEFLEFGKFRKGQHREGEIG